MREHDDVIDKAMLLNLPSLLPNMPSCEFGVHSRLARRQTLPQVASLSMRRIQVHQTFREIQSKLDLALDQILQHFK